MEAAITASLSQLLRRTELLLLWWESSRAQTKSLILGSGQRAVSESHSLTNTLYKVRSCIPKRAASFMPQHLLRSQKCSCTMGQRTLTSLHCQSCTCGTAQRHTGSTTTPLPASSCHFSGPWTPAKVKRKKRNEPKTGQVESKLMAQTRGHLDRN